GVPFFANYAATKSYVLNFGEALHVELKRFGVHVTTLSPGLTATDMARQLPLDLSKLPLVTHSPERVAWAGVSSLGKRASVVPRVINKAFAFFNRVVPRMLPVALFGFLIKRAFRRDIAGKYLLADSSV